MRLYSVDQVSLSGLNFQLQLQLQECWDIACKRRRVNMLLVFVRFGSKMLRTEAHQAIDRKCRTMRWFHSGDVCPGIWGSGFNLRISHYQILGAEKERFNIKIS
uniref:Uncharacterized protein n=1 Tax=Spongospora subterranea TaxID=70186 RepID=A0A0H5RG73_9EUKA|eukprot:CRZ12562.1 hypothetical protein [Spongospora subterranea]